MIEKQFCNMLSYVKKYGENGYTISFEPNLPKWHVFAKIHFWHFCIFSFLVFCDVSLCCSFYILGVLPVFYFLIFWHVWEFRVFVILLILTYFTFLDIFVILAFCQLLFFGILQVRYFCLFAICVTLTFGHFEFRAKRCCLHVGMLVFWNVCV